MGDDDDGCTVLFLEAVHQIENLCLDRNIQSSCRFIANKQLGLIQHGHRDHDPLKHASGHGKGIRLHYPLRVRNADIRDRFQRSPIRFTFLDLRFVRPNDLHQLIADCEEGVQ